MSAYMNKLLSKSIIISFVEWCLSSTLQALVLAATSQKGRTGCNDLHRWEKFFPRFLWWTQRLQCKTVQSKSGGGGAQLSEQLPQRENIGKLIFAYSLCLPEETCCLLKQAGRPPLGELVSRERPPGIIIISRSLHYFSLWPLSLSSFGLPAAFVAP